MAQTQLQRQIFPRSTGKNLENAGLGSPPKLLIIGAGARGNAYARAVSESTNGSIQAVAEPVRYKRETLGQKYIWGLSQPSEGQSFGDWKEYVQYEQERRRRKEGGIVVPPGVDAVFVCTLDETHAEIIVGLSTLGLHLMSEKPLATTLDDCLKIYRSLQPAQGETPNRIFSIGHVLRYSPHNILLRKLLLEDDVIGDVISIEHTEPVGWWHFSHSYVRGNWRRESTTAPSLLTKSCHDIDFLLWLLCSSPPGSNGVPHLPSQVTSSGSLIHFKRSRKPALAGGATNCLSCPAEQSCIYSAKKIYEEAHLAKGHTGWPVDIVDPEIEDYMMTNGKSSAINRLRERLAHDYDEITSQEEIERRPWFGRCVYESDNDVCDDQTVTMTWEDDPLTNRENNSPAGPFKGRGAKTATFHMIAFTEKQCERRGRIYGSKGEIEYDGKTIRVYDFASKQTQTHHPRQPGGGHGGGDNGLAQQYVKAINAVKNQNQEVDEAQQMHIGCNLEEIIRSHAMVFAAEEARKEKKVLNWTEWWTANVETTTRCEAKK
ncbi:hypothetical protein MMC22_010758 [Lobaria immixta]|nr:hypothetical protein [Lobaria immixta]